MRYYSADRDYPGGLPTKPTFMNLGPIGGGKRCLLAGLALTACQLAPQPQLHHNPNTTSTIRKLTEPPGWKIPATPVDSLGPRRFSYKTNLGLSGSSEDVYLKTVNYAAEYNPLIAETIEEHTPVEDIDDNVLAKIVELLRNAEKFLVTFDSFRYKDEGIDLDLNPIASILQQLTTKEVIPVFTLSDLFLHSTDTQFDKDPTENPRAFREFVHRQYSSEYDIYSEIISLSNHSMGYPVYFETVQQDGGRVPKYPIEKHGFKQILDLLVTTRDTTSHSAEQQQTVREMLKTGEQSFQTAVGQFITGEIAASRRCFLHARDTFEEALDMIDNSTKPILRAPITIRFEQEVSIDSLALAAAPAVTTQLLDSLADTEIETIPDLQDTATEIVPRIVERLDEKGEISGTQATILMILSWWHGESSYEYFSRNTVKRRYQQAKHGYNATN